MRYINVSKMVMIGMMGCLIFLLQLAPLALVNGLSADKQLENQCSYTFNIPYNNSICFGHEKHMENIDDRVRSMKNAFELESAKRELISLRNEKELQQKINLLEQRIQTLEKEQTQTKGCQRNSVGDFGSCFATDCMQLLKAGYNTSGAYKIAPLGSFPIDVWCDMKTDGGGWILFQKRVNDSVSFLRLWNDYWIGFGNTSSSFWLGGDNLYALTKSGNQELRIDLWDFNNHSAYATYRNFRISNSTDKFRLSIGAYNGTAGDALTFSNGSQFSTIDQDNDVAHKDTAYQRKGAFWLKNGANANLNGEYHNATYTGSSGIWWWYFGGTSPLKKVEMKIRTLSATKRVTSDKRHMTN